jgi:hypothetical protein
VRRVAVTQPRYAGDRIVSVEVELRVGDGLRMSPGNSLVVGRP